jgi:ribosomal protein uL23
MSKEKQGAGDEKAEYHEIVLYPLITEKAVNMIEAENKLCFIVDRKATKKRVKEAIEATYGIKIDSVKVLNDRKGRKKAVVKVNKQFKADDIATKLGVI